MVPIFILGNTAYQYLLATGQERLIRVVNTTYSVQEQQNIRKTNFLKMANVFSVFRDLKRDVAKKLEKLEKRTQRAIVELISKL